MYIVKTSEIKKVIDIPVIWENMEEVEKRLLQVTISDNKYLTDIAQHLINAGGKRFRPLVSLFHCDLVMILGIISNGHFFSSALFLAA